MVKKTLLLGLIAALGACTDASAPTADDETLLMDAALVAADAVVKDVQLWTQPLSFGGGPQGVQGRGHVAWARGISDRRSTTREVTFYDADGNQQDRYDPLTTERIHLVVEVSGEVSRESWSASLFRSRDMTISGLSGEETERTFNGSGEEEISRSRHTDEGERTYHMSGSFTFSDVVVPAPGHEPRYPISGTITRSLTLTRTNGDDTQTRTVEITITFDGDETATLVVNGETMEVDLTARDGRNPIRGRRHRGG